MGRTGDWWGIGAYEVAPDILLAGKGLTGGYAPLSALLIREEIVATIYKSGKDFVHHQTFAHHPVACAAGSATIRFIQQNHLIDRCRKMGTLLHGELEALRHHRLVGDIRGRGLFAGIELVADKSTKQPFARSLKITERVVASAMARGLVVWSNVGHVDGVSGDLILLAPPFIIEAEQIKAIVGLLAQALDDAATPLE
jgi:adenosylmethionine-8-amino-7-oxononanoate aminotransferase